MKSTHPLQEADLDKFEIALKETAKDLLALRDRFFAVRRAYHQRAEIDQQLTQDNLPLAEQKRLQAQIEELEITLESQLFTWDAFKDVFWQILRFGGLGVLLGWFLRGWAG